MSDNICLLSKVTECVTRFLFYQKFHEHNLNDLVTITTVKLIMIILLTFLISLLDCMAHL